MAQNVPTTFSQHISMFCESLSSQYTTQQNADDTDGSAIEIEKGIVLYLPPLLFLFFFS